MTERELKNLAYEINMVSIFRGVIKWRQMCLFRAFLACESNAQKKTAILGEFINSLSDFNYSFSNFLRHAIFVDENRFVINSAKGKEIPKNVLENVKFELKLFSKLTKLDASNLCNSFNYDGYIPSFKNEPLDFEELYAERLKNINRYGYGIFSSSKMFRVVDDEILPLKSIDEISLDYFVGYDDERKKVYDNTKAFVDGKPALNVLLFGDAGTGKSSTVKACANHFYDDGVRLIELRKDQLLSLSHVMEKIADNPLKFIIFIDDLSFNKNDDNFSMLKAALEGSASAKAKNALIYATSNRRHIVKESFSDRETNDDIHRNDTMQELISLSDRFGLTVYFEKPSKKLYLEIIHKLAENKGLDIPTDELDIKAEAFAMKKGNRSPRAAEQFINSLV